MSILALHPTGNKNFFYLIKSLERFSKLKAIFSSININSNAKIYSILPNKIKFFLNRRDFTNFKCETYSLIPNFELTRLVLSKIDSSITKKILNNYFFENKLYIRFDKEASNKIKKIHGISKVYAYEGSALETFRIAKKNGIKCIYEMPLNYWREKMKIINIEHHRSKKYKKFFIYDDLKSFNKRLDQELSLADQIIVPSSKIKNSLKLYPGKLPRINILNYPYDKIFNSNKKNWFNKKRKMKVLFVGKLDPRKGITYILETLDYLNSKNLMKNFEFTFVGSGKLSNKLKKQFNKIKIYNSLPNHIIIKLMQSSDVLLFPSLFEGYGLSAVEAMSNGMVVICSKNCGFLDSCSKKDVFLIKSISSVNIVKALIFLFKNPKFVKRVGLNSLNTAKKYQLKDYQYKLKKIIEN